MADISMVEVQLKSAKKERISMKIMNIQRKFHKGYLFSTLCGKP